MKRLAIALFLAALATGVHAETVLICHTQSVPVALGKTFQSPLQSTLVDSLFDYFFSKGDITFDTTFSLADGVPSTGWLAGLTGKFGADKVVYLQVIWKQGTGDQAVLDRVDYQVVAPQGTVLAEGSFRVDLTSPSKDEATQVQAIAARMVAGLSS